MYEAATRKNATKRSGHSCFSWLPSASDALSMLQYPERPCNFDLNATMSSRPC